MRAPRKTSSPIGHWPLIIGHSRQRGVAEIETLLVLPVLILMLILIKTSFRLGEDRLSNVYNAEEHAYRYANRPSPNPAGTGSGILDPVPGFTGAVPTFGQPLPNHMHVSNESTTTPPPVRMGMNPVTLTDQAAFAGASWAWSAWPTGDNHGFQDATITHNWFRDYTAIVRDETITDSLMLPDSSPP